MEAGECIGRMSGAKYLKPTDMSEQHLKVCIWQIEGEGYLSDD